MLRTNLARRPFYNERAVHVVLAMATLLVAAVTAYNVTAWIDLSRRQAALTAQVSEAERRASGLQREAVALRRSLDPSELEAVTAGAREANALIARRTFSWIGLFQHIEKTIPPDVRIRSVSPKLADDGTMTITMVVTGRDAEQIQTFLTRLEASGVFSNLLSRQEVVTPEGLLEVTLEGRYSGGVGKPGG